MKTYKSNLRIADLVKMVYTEREITGSHVTDVSFDRYITVCGCVCALCVLLGRADLFNQGFKCFLYIIHVISDSSDVNVE